MGDLEQLLSQLKAAAALHGSAVVESRVSAIFQGVAQAQLQPSPVPRVRARRSRPPERLSPDVTPRAQRRHGNPARDSSGPPSKRLPAGGGDPGRNPLHRRSLRGGDTHHPSGRLPSSIVWMPEHAAAPPGEDPAGGSAQRGRDSAAGAGLSPGAAGGPFPVAEDRQQRRGSTAERTGRSVVRPVTAACCTGRSCVARQAPMMTSPGDGAEARLRCPGNRKRCLLSLRELMQALWLSMARRGELRARPAGKTAGEHHLSRVQRRGVLRAR